MKTNGRILFQRKRQEQANKQGGLCFYCAIKMTAPGTKWTSCTGDHLIPRQQLGFKAQHSGFGNGNLVAACRSCNLARGQTPWRIFRFTMNARQMGVA